MKDYLSYKKGKYINFYFLLNLYIFFYKIKQSLLSSCPKETPFTTNGNECVEGGCSLSLFESGNCKIENEIIRTQYLNRIIKYSDVPIKYVSITTTPNGDLVCISSGDSANSNTTFFYGLKKNGSPYFKVDNQKSYFYKRITNRLRKEGNIFAIKLNSTNNEDEDKDKEYIISFGIETTNFELYDFDNNEVYKEEVPKFFEILQYKSKKTSIFKLNTEQNYYIIAVAGLTPQWSSSSYVYKILFYNLNISAYPPIKIRGQASGSNTDISSCFESENHYIFCYFGYSSKYNIHIYDYNLIQIKRTDINSTFVDNSFFKCIHFYGDAGVFLYPDNNRNFAIQFKEYKPISNTIEDYFNSTSILIIYKKTNYQIAKKFCDMIKLNDKKFLFVLVTNDNNELNIFIINNYVDEKIKIRHYSINNYKLYLFKIKEEFSISQYDGLIAMVFGNNNGTYSATFASIMIFSYPNCTDFYLDITDNFTSFQNPIIKLYEKCNIENNIFGHIFTGYKIYNFTNGIKLLDLQNQIEIEKNVNLSTNTDIELNVTNDVNIEGERIEYGMSAIEPEYDIYNQYVTDINKSYCGEDDCNDEIDYFTPKSYISKISYLYIIFDLNRIGKNCNIGCIICIKNFYKTCLLCEDYFEELPDGRRKCHGEIIIQDTNIITDEPEPMTEFGINTTILITEISTIPSTINDIGTTYLNVESTNPNIDSTIPNIDSTNPNIDSTIPNIDSTIPNINSTIPNTDSTIPNIDSTIPNIESTNFDLESTIPNIESTNFDFESTNPYIVSTNPNIKSTNFNFESTNPFIESTNPNIESTNPKIESTNPNFESTNFDIESTNFSIESTNPNIESSNPNIESTNLDIRSTNFIGSTNPNNESTNPSSKATNPDNESTNPNIETTILKNEDININNDKTCTNDEILDNKCTEGRMSVNQIDDIKKTLFSKNKTNETSIIRTENVIIQLSTVDSQKNQDDSDISSIDLGECENRLKDANNIPREDNLIIFKTDIKTEDLSATYVLYEIYHPYSLERLSLAVCNDDQISINVPIKLNSDIESLVNSLSNSGYDLFNENDSFYNDICATYTSQKGTDMLLSDRKKDIYEVGQNQSMCQIGCKFLAYNITSQKAKCNCSASEENITSINIDDQFGKKEIVDNFYNTLTNANFHVLKCYKLIINSSIIKKNIGEILMSVLFIIFIILLIIFLFNGQKQIHNFFNIIIKLKNISNIEISNRNKSNKEKTRISQNNSNKNKNKKSTKKNKSKKENNILNLNKSNKKKKNLL